LNQTRTFAHGARTLLAWLLCAISSSALQAANAPGVGIEILAFPGVSTATEFQPGTASTLTTGTVSVFDSLRASSEMLRQSAAGGLDSPFIKLYAETFDEGSASLAGGVGTLKARSTGFTSIGPVVDPGMDALASALTRVWYFDEAIVKHPVLPVGQVGLFSVRLTMDSTLSMNGDVSGQEIYNSFGLERITLAGAVDTLVAVLLQASIHGPVYDFTFEFAATVGDKLHFSHELQTSASAFGPSSFYDIDASHTAIAGLQILSDGFYLTSSTGGFTVGAPVPEPSTYVLMLGGLFLVGFAAAGRKPA